MTPRYALVRQILLAAAAIEGLTAAGVDVINIGVAATPMLYFAVYHFNADGGIQITGSHNPPDYNGFKMMMGKKSFFGADIQKLGEVAALARGLSHGPEAVAAELAASDRAATCSTAGVSSPAILYMFGIISSRPCDAVNVVVSEPVCSAPCTAPAAPPSLCISITCGTLPQMFE